MGHPAIPSLRGYEHLPASMSFLDVSDSLARIAQRVSAINYRMHSAGLHEATQRLEIFRFRSSDEEKEILAENE
jgi:hypothetical protein